MNLALALDTLALTISDTAPQILRSPGQVIRVRLLSGGMPVTLPSDNQLRFKAKPLNQHDADVLLDVTAFAGDPTIAQIQVATFTAITDTIEALLHNGDANTANDIPSILITGALLWRASDTDPWIETGNFPITLLNSVDDSGDGTPLAMPTPDAWLTARAVRFDIAQTLTDDQKAQALANIGGGAGGSSVNLTLSEDQSYVLVTDADGNPKGKLALIV